MSFYVCLFLEVLSLKSFVYFRGFVSFYVCLILEVLCLFMFV